MATSEEIKTKIEEKKPLTPEDLEFIRTNEEVLTSGQDWAKTARTAVTFGQEEYKEKFIKKSAVKDSSTSPPKLYTDQEKENIWNGMSADSKAELYYAHLYFYKEDSQSALQLASVGGKTAHDAALEKAQFDTSGDIPFVPDFIDGNPVDAEDIITGKAKAPAPPADTTEEDKKRILDEQLATAKQCYLLNFINNFEQDQIEPNQNFSTRVYKLKSKTPEKIFNDVFLPIGHEEVYYDKGGVSKVIHTEVNSANKSCMQIPNRSKFYLLFKKDDVQVDIISFIDKIMGKGKANIKVDLSFEGGNLTTARNDVSTKLTFQIKNFTLLTEDIDYGGTKISLLDVILRPEFVKQSGDNFGKYYQKQFSPDNNRIELTYLSEWHTRETKNESVSDGTKTFAYSNTLRLTMIDQTMEHDEKTGIVSITVNYKGYAETYLNMPYMDVIGGREVLKQRNARESEIIAAMGKNCSIDTVRQIQNNYRLVSRQEMLRNKNRIVFNLFKQGLVYYIDGPDKVALEKIFEQGKISRINTGEPGMVRPIVGPTSNMYYKYNKETEDDPITFVYLSDLLASLADFFYKDDHKRGGGSVSAQTYNETFEDLKIKFLTLPITIKTNSVEIDQGKQQINIGSLPISISFLSKYLEDKYFKKGVEYAPFMSFIRNFIEAAVTQTISDICFAETPWEGTIKTMIIESSENDYITKNETNHIIDTDNLPAGTQLFQAPSSPNINAQGKVIDTGGPDKITYIVIYANVQEYNQTMIDGVIEDINTVGNTDYDISKNFPVFKDKIAPSLKPSPNLTFSFSKTDDPNLRAGRYYAFKNDAFVAIGNVYDLTLKSPQNLGWIFPGHIIISDLYIEADKNWRNADSIGNKIGLHGFFIVYKVSLTYDRTTSKYETTLSTKFLDSVLGKTKPAVKKTKKADAEPAECNQYLKNSANAFIEGQSVTPVGETNENVNKKEAQTEKPEKTTNEAKPNTSTTGQPPSPTETTLEDIKIDLGGNSGVQSFTITKKDDKYFSAGIELTKDQLESAKKLNPGKIK